MMNSKSSMAEAEESRDDIMRKSVSHDRDNESLEAKARWFQSLSLAERMDLLCEFTDLALENNPRVAEVGRAQSSSERIRVLSLDDVRVLELGPEESS